MGHMGLILTGFLKTWRISKSDNLTGGSQISDLECLKDSQEIGIPSAEKNMGFHWQKQNKIVDGSEIL